MKTKGLEVTSPRRVRELLLQCSCVERPMFPLEVPGLLGGILYQRPLRLRERLRKAPLAFPRSPAGFAASGSTPRQAAGPRWDLA